MSPHKYLGRMDFNGSPEENEKRYNDNRKIRLDDVSHLYFLFLRNVLRVERKLKSNEISYYQEAVHESVKRFLTNAHLRHDKYVVDYISEEARKKIKQKETKGFVLEHIIPKEEYIHKPCENCVKKFLAKKIKECDAEKEIRNILDKYFYLALISKQENQLLGKKLAQHMPPNWDRNDILARYKNKKIDLLPIFKFKNA